MHSAGTKPAEMGAKHALKVATEAADTLSWINRNGMIPGSIDLQAAELKRAAKVLRRVLRERDALVTVLANVCDSIPVGRKGLRVTAQSNLRQARNLVAKVYDSNEDVDAGAVDEALNGGAGTGSAGDAA